MSLHWILQIMSRTILYPHPYFPILSLPTSPLSNALSHCWDKYLGTWIYIRVRLLVLKYKYKYLAPFIMSAVDTPLRATGPRLGFVWLRLDWLMLFLTYLGKLDVLQSTHLMIECVLHVIIYTWSIFHQRCGLHTISWHILPTCGHMVNYFGVDFPELNAIRFAPFLTQVLYSVLKIEDFPR